MYPGSNVIPSADVPNAQDVAILVGLELRAARQRRGENLYDVADLLRIKPSYLFALEDGDYGAMPGLPYALGFLRSYASHLGLDGAKLIRRLKAGRPATSARTELVYPLPPDSERRSSMTMMLAALLVIGLGYGGWSYLMRPHDPSTEMVAMAPAMRPGQVSAPLASPPRPSDDVGTARQTSLGAKGVTTEHDQAALQFTPTNGGTVTTSTPLAPAATVEVVLPGAAEPTVTVPPPTSTAPIVAGQDPVVTETASATVAAAVTPPLVDEGRPDPGVGSASASEARVVIVATEPSWIQVRSVDRQFSRSRLMETGEHFPLPERSDLALWTGNAGGLQLMVDGQQMQPLGARGAVLKNIPLDPAALKARTGTP